jgi:hypothetical protein
MSSAESPLEEACNFTNIKPKGLPVNKKLQMVAKSVAGRPLADARHKVNQKKSVGFETS